MRGLWHALDVFWINDPGRDEVAHRKLLQLRVAQEVGLEIPSTLVTNDLAEARSFVDAHGYRDVICKAFSATEQQWRETRLVGEEELAALENVRYAPVIFQEYVERHDLRVTVVGDQIFPAAIHSQESEYPVDFRMDMANARIEAELPGEVAERFDARRPARARLRRDRPAPDAGRAPRLPRGQPSRPVAVRRAEDRAADRGGPGGAPSSQRPRW